MKFKYGGNGSGKPDIVVQDFGGWVRVFPSKADLLPDDLPIALSNALAEYRRKMPSKQFEFAVEITKHGSTVALHAWYRQ